MLGTVIGRDASKSSGISWNLEQVTFNSIREVLPDRVSQQACEDCHHHYRHRALTPVVIVLHMILSAVWPEKSFQAGWQMLWDNAVGIFAGLRGKSP